jgi:hypothetical protein
MKKSMRVIRPNFAQSGSIYSKNICTHKFENEDKILIPDKIFFAIEKSADHPMHSLEFK